MRTSRRWCILLSVSLLSCDAQDRIYKSYSPSVCIVRLASGLVQRRLHLCCIRCRYVFTNINVKQMSESRLSYRTRFNPLPHIVQRSVFPRRWGCRGRAPPRQRVALVGQPPRWSCFLLCPPLTRPSPCHLHERHTSLEANHACWQSHMLRALLIATWLP